jgi:hypothetical protein
MNDASKAIGPALFNGGKLWCMRCNKPVESSVMECDYEPLWNENGLVGNYLHSIRYQIWCHGETYMEVHYPNGITQRSQSVAK